MGSKNPFQTGPAGRPETPPPDSPFQESKAPPPPAPPENVDVEDDTPREIDSVPSSMWTVAGYLVLFTFLGLTGYSLLEQKKANDRLINEIADRDQRMADADRNAVKQNSALANAKETIKDLQHEAAELKRAKEAAATAQSDMESRMRGALASKDVTISELEGKLTLNILDRILFDSGQAVIKPGGQEVLRKIAAVLDQFPNRQIQVMGHTDNVPIHTAQFPSNWELSSARALAAVRFLVEEAGVNPARLAAVAHGEFQPVADNATTEGRAQNRRIAVVVLPEVFNQPTSATTNAPPVQPTLQAPAPDGSGS